MCYCFTQGYTRNSAQRKRGILSEIETTIKKSAWSWNQRQSSTKWGKICAKVSYETWRIQQSLLTGRSLPFIPREVNDIAVLSQFCDKGITKCLQPYKYTPVEEDYQTKKYSSCRFLNSEYGLEKEPNINSPQWKKSRVGNKKKTMSADTYLLYIFNH